MVDDLKNLQDLNGQTESEYQSQISSGALDGSETRFRSIAQAAVDAIISINSSDEIIFWNKAAEKIFGYTEEEILGKPAATLMPERYREAHRNGIARYLGTGRKVLIGRILEVQGLRKNGEEFPLELSLSTWKSGEEVFFTGIIRDISDRKAAEKALEKSTIEAKHRTSELESLVQMVAHDLKSPVLTIAGLVRVLANRIQKIGNGTDLQPILKQLTVSSETMERFLRDLLDGLALEQSPPKLEPLSLEEIITEVSERHSQLIHDKGITLQILIPTSSIIVLGDRPRVCQVLDNLLINAIRYIGSRSDPAIAIRVADEQGFCVTSVSDNGVGIPQKYHDRIFERFFRVTGSDKPEGTGLGLSIVKSIVQSHGGRIWVESEEGRGATFKFTLPKAER
jgi:PAS domain S-box-containing protein